MDVDYTPEKNYGIIWSTFDDSFYSLKSVYMAIRPKITLGEDASELWSINLFSIYYSKNM